MIGKLDPAKKKIKIIGGGFSGLVLAHFALKNGFAVEIFEKAPRTGGLLQTHRLNSGLSEQAAHSVLATPIVRDFFSDIGVELSPLQEESKARFVLRNGQPRKLPLRVLELLELLYRALFYKSQTLEQSLDTWARHHLGEAALQYLISPMVTGIYGCSPAELSLKAAFPRFQVPVGKSLFYALRKAPRQGKGHMCAPRDGMSDLVLKLEKGNLRAGAVIHKNHEITEEEFKQILADDDSNVALCTPAYESARLLSSVQQYLSESLKQVRYAPLVTTTIFIEKTPHTPQGVGILIPKGEGRRILGVLYNSSSFKDRVQSQKISSYTVMMGGTSDPRITHLSAHAIHNLIEAELQTLWGHPVKILESKVFSWPEAIPIYNDHLLKTWELAQRTWVTQPGRVLFGNYTGQVSLRGMIEAASKI